ncbi:hypothetical protein GCM10007242_38340 [Pigmentiphaga litoralis]|nr:hypothetical protein GCM10007242_38340 [Pigmentiphaga litoralis]
MTMTNHNLSLRAVIAASLMQLALPSAPVVAADAVLLNAADGPSFTIGSTPYQVVTSARAVSSPDPRGSTGTGTERVPRDVTGASSAVVGRIGNYRITLGSTSAYVPHSAASPEYAVAVNRRSGGPALVSRRLKLFKVSADQAAAVARQTGGSVEIAVPAASMAVLLYASPSAALVALDAIHAGGSGAQAEPEVIQAFMTPR